MQERGQAREPSYSVDIVREVAAKEGVDPLDLPPLYGVINPEQVDALVASASTVNTIEFEYYGYTITVSGDGTVRVTAKLEAEAKTESSARE